MSSAKFDALTAEVHSRNLAGYITTHNKKVKARADATRTRHRAERLAAKKKRKKKTSTEMSAEHIMKQVRRR